MGKRKDLQRAIRAWKDETGEKAIDMNLVARWLVRKGWPLPTPQDPIDILAKQIADAGKEEIGHDPDTGHPFRVYHAVPVKVGQETLFHYYDIHEAPRKVMQKSLVNRREQMVSDGVQLTLDELYWRKCHPGEEPIPLPMDLAPDIEWKLAVPKDEDKAA